MNSTGNCLWINVSNTTRDQCPFSTANTHITVVLNFQHEAYNLFKQYLLGKFVTDEVLVPWTLLLHRLIWGRYNHSLCGWSATPLKLIQGHVSCLRAQLVWLLVTEWENHFCIQLDVFGTAAQT